MSLVPEGASILQNFVYDSIGNLIEDKSKSLKISYDWRGMPVAYDGAGRRVSNTRERKERDDETELNYFGARYLDPMLGLWISVDPKRQFSSPYLYVGNGVNPIGVIDPDGNEVELKNEQTTLLGHINSAFYDQYVLDGNTLVPFLRTYNI